MLFEGIGISTYIRGITMYVTDEEMDVYRFIKTGERLFNLKRLCKCKTWY